MEVVASESSAASDQTGGVDSNGDTYSSIEEMWASHGINAPPSATGSSKKRSHAISLAPLGVAAGAASNSSEELDPSTANVADAADADARIAREAISRWYQTGASFWAGEEASVSGMLGGLTQVHPADIKTTISFLQSLKVDRLLALGARRLLCIFSRCLNVVCLRVVLCIYSLTIVADCGAGIGRVTEGALCQVFDKIDLVEQDRKYIRKAEENLKAKAYAGEARENAHGLFYLFIAIQQCIIASHMQQASFFYADS
jgi:hypothetical protein